ncbi:hypothetical protein TNCV_1059161 [Trichonephila clavipes]|nr:hypothetical protein TNCV_1059161 [Trichonephila clavipes]
MDTIPHEIKERHLGFERVAPIQDIEQRRPLRYYDASMGNWRNRGDRTKLKSFGDYGGYFGTHIGDLATMLASLQPYGFF